MQKADFERIARQLGDESVLEKKPDPPRPEHHHSHEHNHAHSHEQTHHQKTHIEIKHQDHSHKKHQTHKHDNENHRQGSSQKIITEMKVHNGFSLGVSVALGFWFVTIVIAGIIYYCLQLLSVI